MLIGRVMETPPRQQPSTVLEKCIEKGKGDKGGEIEG